MKSISKYPPITIIALVLLLSSFVSIPCSDTPVVNAKLINEISFIENSWTLAAKKAKAEHKLIFVDAYAVWCGPCKLLKSTTFKDPKAAEFFNKNFVNLSIDMEKGEGVALSDKWKIDSYPTLMVLDDSGRVVLSSIGYLPAKDLIEFGKQALEKQKKNK
ncbi:thioredoxin 1 [Pedobacter sp. UYP30]|uniref:thioredoxin family protein n=1 Tax=Pedobacter sp. UYP30 TaxID=1756400 RepID=UPI0033949662